MYPCTKFKSIWRTSDFGTKLPKKIMNDKVFEKINIKIVISTWQCIPVLNFSQFEEIQILGSNLLKTIRMKRILKK